MGFLYAARKTKTNTFESITLSWLGTHQNYWWLMTTLQPAPSIIQHEEKASNNNKDSFLITSNLIFRREKRSGENGRPTCQWNYLENYHSVYLPRRLMIQTWKMWLKSHVLKQSMQDSFDSLVSIVIGWSYYFLLSEQISFFTALCWMKVSCLMS